MTRTRSRLTWKKSSKEWRSKTQPWPRTPQVWLHSIHSVYFPSEWDLHDSLKSLVEVQAETLESMKPTISYFVNSNRFVSGVVWLWDGFNDCQEPPLPGDWRKCCGHLYLSVHSSGEQYRECNQWQDCFQVEDPMMTISGIQFTCPPDMVVAGTGEVCKEDILWNNNTPSNPQTTGISPCLDGVCQEEINKTVCVSVGKY